MIYTYTFKKSFFDDLVKSYSLDETSDLFEFLKEKFIQKENTYFIKTDNIFYSYGGSAMSQLIKKFYQTLNNQVTTLSCKECDFIFTGNDTNDKKYININKILNKNKKICENFSKDLKKKISISWDAYNNKDATHEILKEKLVNIIKYSQKIYFIDRYIPKQLLENKSQKITYIYSLEFLGKIFEKFEEIDLRFFSSIDKKFKKDYPNINSVATEIKKYFSKFKPGKAMIEIKNETTWHKNHERYIMSFHNEETNVFHLSYGIDFVKDKAYSINPERKFYLLPRDAMGNILENWIKNVQKAHNYLILNS